MIEKCALALITDRGRNVIAPTLSELNEDEQDFLSRHVGELRGTASSEETRGRFRHDSTLPEDLEQALSFTGEAFVAVASRIVDQLALAMRGKNSKDCVLAFLVDVSGDAVEPTVSILKLDAEVEAARLETQEGGIRLHVYQDLLPRPGDIQKGISWPDPRAPHSDVIILDNILQGTAIYFQDAYKVDASASALQTEKSLVKAVSEMPSDKIEEIVPLIQDGGRAEDLIEKIKSVNSEFVAESKELGAGGSMPGTLRPNFIGSTLTKFRADGIELKLPLDRFANVTTRQVGDHFETTIRTSEPLTPPRRL